jgi:thiol-disulfide isomerase/thioredoxin
VIFCGVLFIGGAALSSAQSGFGASKGLPKHFQSPDFHLQTVDGTAVSKQSLKGQPTLMMFWAPWCHVCQVELPKIHDFHEAVKPYGLQVLSVGFADARASVLGYIHDHPDVFTFPSAYDAGGVVAATFRIRATPTFVLLDADGFIRLVHPGAGVLHNPKLQAFVEDLAS